MVSLRPRHDIIFEKYRLQNGLDVILHEDHSAPIAAVNVWYHVGSQDEEPDRTGFAHLFEHIMFKGSKHHNREYFLPLQEVGANVNGSTTVDRTNYYENVPAEYLELALWLESDRMGFLLDALDQHSFETERDVVKNERRQSYENRPYGLAGEHIQKALFPPEHPYHWETIGSMAHLDAASLDDVKDFFRRYYLPNNASLSIAGDIDINLTKALVDKYFGSLTPGPTVARVQHWVPQLDGEVRLQLDDRVQFQRLYLAWVGPSRFDPDEAPLDVLESILAEGRSSRLYRSLVYDKQIARDVNARYSAMEIAGVIRIDATIVPGADLGEVERVIFAEIERARSELPTPEEIERALNRLRARHVRQLESVGGFGGRANILNYYNVYAGDPGLVNRDLDRYEAVTAEDVRRVAATYFGEGRVRLVVSPKEEVSPTTSDLDRSLQPGPGLARGFRPPVPQRIHLKTGADLVVMERRQVPAIAAAVYVPGGSVTDPSDLPGLASFTTRLLNEGTTSRSSQQIADESEFIAARLNTHVDREYYVATTEVLTEHWPKALNLLADVLQHPVFPEREVERVRRERLMDLRRLRDDPGAIAARVVNGLLFGRETPQGHPSSGRESSVAEMSRDALVTHHAATVLAQQPTFVVVGDVDPDAVARQLEDAFGEWAGHGQNGAAAKLQQPSQDPSNPNARPATIYLIDKPGAAQSIISAGQVTVGRLDPDFMPLVVMNMAFGGQFTARLNMNLRDAKGYTYGYHSYFDWRTAQSGFVTGGSVHSGVTTEALLETLKEFHELQSSRPISEDEFEKARMGLIRGYPPTFETSGQIVGRLLDLAHYGLPDDYFTHQVERLEAVTLADIRRVAVERLTPDALQIVIVGDRAAIEAGLETTNLPIVHMNHEGEIIP